MKVYLVQGRSFEDGQVCTLACFISEEEALADAAQWMPEAEQFSPVWVEEHNLIGKQGTLTLRGQCQMAEALKFAVEQLQLIGNPPEEEETAEARKHARSAAKSVEYMVERLLKDEKVATG